VLIAAIVGLVLFFTVLLFPWDSLARRVAWEISTASGGQVTISTLSPAITPRGPVLRAREVVIEHPALDRLRLSELEIAPRQLVGWLTGAPSLRIWTITELGQIDGVLGLGESMSFVGKLTGIELARLPLRLAASDVQLGGQLDGTADITLDPEGTLRGQMSFLSTSLVVTSGLLPTALSFEKAEGVVEILENGATRIKSLRLEGESLEGEISGEIGLSHHSQSPPIDLEVDLRVVDPGLRQLALAAGIPISRDGRLKLRVGGRLAAPDFGDGLGRAANATPKTRASRHARNRKN
jgi:type II secretion system protein N